MSQRFSNFRIFWVSVSPRNVDSGVNIFGDVLTKPEILGEPLTNLDNFFAICQRFSNKVLQLLACLREVSILLREVSILLREVSILLRDSKNLGEGLT